MKIKIILFIFTHSIKLSEYINVYKFYIIRWYRVSFDGAIILALIKFVTFYNVLFHSGGSVDDECEID